MASPFAINLFGQERDDVGIHPNSVGTAELENGSVTAAKLATSFPQGTLGYAETQTAQTGITTVVDLTGLSVAVTVPAGRRIRISGLVMFHNQVAAANWALLEVAEGTTVLNDSLVSFGANGTDQQYGSTKVTAVVTPTASTHTYKLRAFATSGAVNTLASATRRPFILVEDITAITASQPIAVPTGLWRASADFPANPAEGDLFYETDTDKLWAWNGTAWFVIGEDTGWVNVTLLNSWVVYDNTYGPSGFSGLATAPLLRRKNGVVYLRGIIRSGTLSAAMLTLPVGYRPAGRPIQLFAVHGAGGVNRIDIDGTTGSVVGAPGDAGYTSLNNLRFIAEQ